MPFIKTEEGYVSDEKGTYFLPSAPDWNRGRAISGKKHVRQTLRKMLEEDLKKLKEENHVKSK